MGLIGQFARNASGGIAVTFSLSLILLVTGAGVAIDYSRQSDARTQLQSALDAAMLMSGKQALATGRRVSTAEFRRNLQANLREEYRHLARGLVLTQDADKLSARVEGEIDNRFGSFLGQRTARISAGASVPLGSTRIEIALVLDSTGSMSAYGKMDVLKQAANGLIDTLTQGQSSASEVAFAVVPFANQVRVATSYAGSSWLDFRAAQANPAENSDPSTWDGCIMDRDKPHNSSTARPSEGGTGRDHPAQNCRYTNLQPILPLTTDIPAVRARIGALTPAGTTNTTIGLSWGYSVMTRNYPLADNVAPASRKAIRVMVFLTDGMNTQDRFGQSPALMDTDMRTLCEQVKTSDIRVFTIRVIEGNEPMLRDCASNPADYYNSTDAAGISRAFKDIANKLVSLRLSS